MLFTTATLGLIAVIPALASPIQKRYTGVRIRSGRDNTCLSLAPKEGPSNGYLLQNRDCLYSTTWDISPGSGSVLVSSANGFNSDVAYALDAGVPQGNNNPAKIWQSYPGSQQQTWYLTDDNRIAVTGGDQCLDLGDNGPQTYQCSPGNQNQVWYLDPVNLAPSIPHTPSSSASAPSASATGNPSTQITYAGNVCLQTSGQAPYNGIPVYFGLCAVAGQASAFNFLPNGEIQLAGSNYCVDAGSNPADGVNLKLWTCGGYPQQTWKQIGGGLIQTANNECMDVKREDLTTAQTWTCSASDNQQKFNVAPFA